VSFEMCDDVHIPGLLDGVILPIKVLQIIIIINFFFFLYKYVLFIYTKNKKNKKKKKHKPFAVKPQYYVCRVLPKKIL
jgi:cbb3-type cytochrome oxidase subunit 3